ncbi:MAG: branched-chain amino acid ABC transporter permease [Candidatus Tectimicrobiota bacterium]|nr:MAG: branched-chain amino acid ABC transporter permease [Candidatus Tectomicrobia bacterium]
MPLTFYLVQAFNGITFGALLFLLASGFTLIFGLMRVVSLTHGAFYLLGGYIGLTALRPLGNFGLAVVAGALAIGLVGVLIERFLLRRVWGQPLAEALLTFGLAFILADAVLMIWGGDPRNVPIPRFLRGSVVAFGLFFPKFRLFTLLLGVGVALFLWWLLACTRVGRIIRAGVDDLEMVAALGINIRAVFTGVFCLGSMLAGLAGVVGGAFLSLYPGADAEILLLGLVVVILGGLGSLEGAVVGSLVVGLLDTFGKAFFPELSYFTIFGPMALVLALRPRGLFGRV